MIKITSIFYQFSLTSPHVPFSTRWRTGHLNTSKIHVHPFFLSIYPEIAYEKQKNVLTRVECAAKVILGNRRCFTPATSLALIILIWID